MLDGAAAVELRVENISREDCRKLEEALSALFNWRREQPAQADAFQAQLMSGSLRLDVAKLISNGVLEWMDTLRPAQARPTEAQEPVEEPRYERCDTGELLAPPLVDSTLLLPGGAAAAKRRQAAQAAAEDWSDGAGCGAAGADGNPLAKRRRVGLNKCHNCGSYKHGVNRCPMKLDQRRVQAAVAEVRAERGPVDPMAQMRLRYFDMPGGAAADQRRAERPPPGVISAGLAEALGMPSSTAPPPWLTRMAVLGVPPRYAEQNEQQADDAAEAGEQLMVFFRGSEDEEEGADAAAGAGPGAETNGLGDTAAAAAAGGGDGGMNGAGGGDSGSSSDDDGFIPFDGGAAAADQRQQEQPPLPPPQDDAGHGQQQQQQQEANGAARTGASSKPPKWVFPGLNGEVPPNTREEWTAALQTAAWLQTRLT